MMDHAALCNSVPMAVVCVYLLCGFLIVTCDSRIGLSVLYTVSSDRSFATVDLSTSSILQRMPDAHPYVLNKFDCVLYEYFTFSVCRNPINCMTLYSESLMCTGDDEGEIKVYFASTNSYLHSYMSHFRLIRQVWDIRSSTPVMTFSLDEHTDFVSDLCPQADRNILLSTGYSSSCIFNFYILICVIQICAAVETAPCALGTCARVSCK
jgi:WD40 repeat protein